MENLYELGFGVLLAQRAVDDLADAVRAARERESADDELDDAVERLEDALASASATYRARWPGRTLQAFCAAYRRFHDANVSFDECAARAALYEHAYQAMCVALAFDANPPPWRYRGPVATVGQILCWIG